MQNPTTDFSTFKNGVKHLFAQSNIMLTVIQSLILCMAYSLVTYTNG